MTVSATTTTRGGWTPTGTSAARREILRSATGTRADRTRRRLLDAARKVFAAQGYVDTTVELIVTEAGVARGSFYSYFESKADVLSHLGAALNERIGAAVVGFSRVGDDLVANLRVSTRNYLRVVEGHADVYRLVDQVALFDDVVRDGRRRNRRAHVDRVARTIRRWQSAGVADAGIDADSVAEALVAMQSTMARWAYVDAEGERDPEVLAETIVSVWVRSCGLMPEAGR